MDAVIRLLHLHELQNWRGVMNFRATRKDLKQVLASVGKYKRKYFPVFQEKTLEGQTSVSVVEQPQPPAACKKCHDRCIHQPPRMPVGDNRIPVPNPEPMICSGYRGPDGIHHPCFYGDLARVMLRSERLKLLKGLEKQLGEQKRVGTFIEQQRKQILKENV